jgi:hypothetical protein
MRCVGSEKRHFHRYTATELNSLGYFEFKPLQSRYRPLQSRYRFEFIG